MVLPGEDAPCISHRLPDSGVNVIQIYHHDGSNGQKQVSKSMHCFKIIF